MKGLDVGCGVGGPMRTIASTSGAHITGITINDYQVKRAVYHNYKVSLTYYMSLETPLYDFAWLSLDVQCLDCISYYA